MMEAGLNILRNTVLIFCVTSSLHVVSVTCQGVSSPCNSNPCQNGATCVLGEGGSYFCTCAPSFTGYNCETDFLPCESQSCQNGGSCYPGIGRSYYCTCAAGYAGDNCEREFYPCMSQPCQNGASCFPGIGGSYYCICAPGYSGYDCETEFYPCQSQPCQNGGSCFPGTGGSYYCTCAAGFAGYNCEKGRPTQIPSHEINAGALTEVLNGDVVNSQTSEEPETETPVVSTMRPESAPVPVIIIVVVITTVVVIVLILTGIVYLRCRGLQNKEKRKTGLEVEYGFTRGIPLPPSKTVFTPQSRKETPSAGYEDAASDKAYKEKHGFSERDSDVMYDEIPEQPNNYDRTLYISSGYLGKTEVHIAPEYVNKKRYKRNDLERKFKMLPQT